jgi:hypothetical protein
MPLLLSPFLVTEVHAEPTLPEVFTALGFTNVAHVNNQTFPQGRYNITMCAEFAGYYATNELSYYQVNTTTYNIIFTGPEGNNGYVIPPIMKTFSISYEFGLSFWVADGPHRYFTQDTLNPDGQVHSEVYQNLNNPSMYLIGFENLYGAVDRDFQDMVISIQPEHYLDVISPYSTPGGSGWYYGDTYANATLAQGLIDCGNGTRRVFTGWSGDASGTNYAQSNQILMDQNKTAIANWKTQYYLTVTSPYGSPTPASGWYDEGTPMTSSVTSPQLGPTGTRYVCTGWNGTGSAPSSGTGTSTSFTINSQTSVTWNWKTQYLLTVVTDPAGLSPQPTRNPLGETGSANSWWYDQSTPVTLAAQTIIGYSFNNWDIDGTSQGTTNPVTPTMNNPHTATAHCTQLPPLTVSINPLLSTIIVGQSVNFASNVTGGLPSYTYKWILDSSPVPGASSSTWIFTPSLSGIYFVQLEVKDSQGTTVTSLSARVEVLMLSVGGYTVTYERTSDTLSCSPQLGYLAIIVGLCGLLSLTRRRKR